MHYALREVAFMISAVGGGAQILLFLNFLRSKKITETMIFTEEYSAMGTVSVCSAKVP